MEYSGPTSENLYVWVCVPGQLVIKQLHAPAFSPWMDNSKKNSDSQDACMHNPLSTN